ncbi:MAG: sortase [Oscillospiraceae bacterium]|nr:sortase [Oscillospiraceae bacterium]
MKRKIRGSILILLGLLLAFSGAALYAGYERQASLAEQRAEILLAELHHTMEERHLGGVVAEAPEGQMPQILLEGYALIGVLEAEEAGIRLPIIESWSYESLQYSPCRYSGSLEEENLILLGHNYHRHLGNLGQLETGDVVTFTDINGKIYTFAVASAEKLKPTQVEELKSNPYPLAIFTCTDGGESRYVVYCEKRDGTGN